MQNPLEFDLKTSESSSSKNSTENINSALESPQLFIPAEVRARWREHIKLGKIALFVISLYLFMLAIALMRTGARGMTAHISNFYSISNLTTSLGFGWVFAYIMMSGSPVAAASLTFFDAGVINELSAYSMIIGSRLGASFIVLLIGFIYVLRGRDRATSLGMGILSLMVTATTYLPGLLLGIFFLQTGMLDNIQLGTGVLLSSVIDTMVDPFTNVVAGLFPYWAIFLIGLGFILVSFNLFDKCLPRMTLRDSQIGWLSRLVYRPFVMFLLGATITMISMSVSISLSLLVPLSQRGFVRRENVIPYIMGANITTFVDTLLAALMLDNPAAFTVVLVNMVSISIISILILVIFYQQYQGFLLRFVNGVTSRTKNLAIFMFVILITPVILFIL